MDGQGLILIIVLIALLVIYPFLMSFRNKKEQQKQTAMANSLKKGDYIITYSGVYGKITEISEKEIGKFITIETGETHKNYVTISANAVYMVTNNKPIVASEKKTDINVPEKTKKDLKTSKDLSADDKQDEVALKKTDTVKKVAKASEPKKPTSKTTKK